MVGNLEKHVNAVHHGKKDHKCEICGKSFTSGGDLRKHINAVHNGKK